MDEFKKKLVFEFALEFLMSNISEDIVIAKLEELETNEDELFDLKKSLIKRD